MQTQGRAGGEKQTNTRNPKKRMKEYWEITHERGVATYAVWALAPAFELRGLTRAQHLARVDSLPGLAQARDSRETELSNAFSTRDTRFAQLGELDVRVPAIIEGMLTEDDELHGQLDAIRAVDVDVSEDQKLRRGRLVRELWEDYNAVLAALVPPVAALLVPYRAPGSDAPAVNVGLAAFDALIAACLQAQAGVAAAQTAVTNAKGDLRKAEAKADRDNKRWYLAWCRMFPEGTQEGDAARSDVPTEAGTLPPVALEIASLAASLARLVTLTYPASGGEHATTLELQYRLPGEVEFGHSTPVVRPEQTVGPFPAGSTVTFRTRGANSTPGVVLSQPKTVLIPG